MFIGFGVEEKVFERRTVKTKSVTGHALCVNKNDGQTGTDSNLSAF
jgi:hypothetical protein